MNRTELEQKIDEFVGLKSDINDEFWETPADRARCVLEDFVAWLFHDDIEKEKRRAQYEELKKEFGDSDGQS